MIWRLLALAEQLDDGLLRQVFTHSSWVAERGRSYERLEFLGDSVLSLAVTTELYRRFPDHSEGSLARLRAYIVSRATCAKVATRLGLPEFVRRFGTGHEAIELDQLVSNENILADMTESLIGAVYLTYGLDVVRPAVIEAFAEHISFAERSYVDFKTELQEQLAKSGRSVIYQLVETVGPPHSREFVLEAVVDGVALGRGMGASKKRAEQDAAAEALRELSGAERPKRRRARGRRRGAGADSDTPVGDEAVLDAAADEYDDAAVRAHAEAVLSDAVVDEGAESAQVVEPEVPTSAPGSTPVVEPEVPTSVPEGVPGIEPDAPALAAESAPIAVPVAPAPEVAPVVEPEVPAPAPESAPAVGVETATPLDEASAADAGTLPAQTDADSNEPPVADEPAAVDEPATADEPAAAGEPATADEPPVADEPAATGEPATADEPAPRVVFDMGAATRGHTVLRSYSVEVSDDADVRKPADPTAGSAADAPEGAGEPHDAHDSDDADGVDPAADQGAPPPQADGGV